MTTEFEMPKEWTGEIFIHMSVDPYSFGEIKVWSFEDRWSDNNVLIDTQEITVTLPRVTEEMLKSGVVTKLKEKKADILAEAHKKAQAVQDQIDQLLAITYQAAE